MAQFTGSFRLMARWGLGIQRFFDFQVLAGDIQVGFVTVFVFMVCFS
jgi:hypothetical protein